MDVSLVQMTTRTAISPERCTAEQRKALRNTPWNPEASQQAKDLGLCGAKTRHATCCLNAKGKGTDHPGFGSCKFHLGATANGKKHAEEERLTTRIEQLLVEEGIETDDPVGGLAEAQRRAQVMARVCERLLKETDQLYVENAKGELVPHVAEQMMARWNDKAANTSKLAIDARLDERREERQQALNEQQGALLAEVLRGVFAGVEARLVAAGVAEAMVKQVFATDVPVLLRRAMALTVGEEQ